MFVRSWSENNLSDAEYGAAFSNSKSPSSTLMGQSYWCLPPKTCPLFLSFVSGSHTEAQLSTANILSECLMLRDNLLSLSVDFLRQDILDFVSHLCVA